jgi:hypothetical protein
MLGPRGTIHRQSKSALEKLVFQLDRLCDVWDQDTNRFRGLGPDPDSEIAALPRRLFHCQVLGGRITPCCDNFPPTTV